MMPCTRGPAPEVLAREGAQIGRDYAERRRLEAEYRFQWPKRGGQSVLAIVREALVLMTAGHCSYCDGHPLDATGEETVDHFQPKGRPEFYELVCTWTNLFLTCTACNKAKQDQWEEALLRPDDLEYRFERYFEYRFDSGKLEPASTASPEEQRRAQQTIDIFNLNRPGTCQSRKLWFSWMRSLAGADDPNDCAYRYLIPLCRAV